MAFIDLVTYLPDDILTKVDRASMAVGLEVRVPLLDHRIVEFSKKIPLSLKVKHQNGKYLLKKLLYKYIPENKRQKVGFSVPINEWLRGPLREWGTYLLNEKKISEDSILNPVPIKKFWNEHINGNANWSSILWNVLIFQAWKEKWM